VKTPIRHIRENYPNKKGEIYIIYTPIPHVEFLANLPNSLLTDIGTSVAGVKFLHAAFRVYNNDEGGFVQYEISICLQEELAEKLE